MSATETEREAPRRLRAADVIEQQQRTIEALTTRTTAEPSASVEISRNAKGEVQHTVKVYATASADEDDVRRATERAFDQAVQAFDTLNTLHPFGGA